MEKEKLEQWITKRSIQKHSVRKPKQYKGRKTFAKSLIIDLDKPKNQAEELLFNLMRKYE